MWERGRKQGERTALQTRVWRIWASRSDSLAALRNLSTEDCESSITFQIIVVSLRCNSTLFPSSSINILQTSLISNRNMGNSESQSSFALRNCI